MSTQIPARPGPNHGTSGHSLPKTTAKGTLQKVSVPDILRRGLGYPDAWVPDVPGISCPKALSLGHLSVLNRGVKVWVHPAECGQLQTDPSHNGCCKFLGSFWREHFGACPSHSPSLFGIRLCFVHPPPLYWFSMKLLTRVCKINSLTINSFCKILAEGNFGPQPTPQRKDLWQSPSSCRIILVPKPLPDFFQRHTHLSGVQSPALFLN